MDWHVFWALSIFFCDSYASNITVDTGPQVHLCHAENRRLYKHSILDSDTYEARHRIERSPQLGFVLPQGNLPRIRLPEIASGIGKGIHNILDSIRTPISIEIKTSGRDRNVHKDSSRPREDLPLVSPTHEHAPPHPNNQHPPHCSGRQPSLPNDPMPKHSYHRRRQHHQHRPRYPQNTAGCDEEDEDKEEEDTDERKRPDFSSQPNYPGNQGPIIDLNNQGSDQTLPPKLSDSTVDHSSQILYPHSHDNKRKDNVAGYTDDNFPVILLTQNEIR